jgi:hypothetical protein
MQPVSIFLCYLLYEGKWKHMSNFERVPLEEVTKITGIGMDGLPVAKKKCTRVQIGREGRMHTFDIFRMQADGEPLWLDTAGSLEEGRNQIVEMRKSVPGEYFLFDQKTQEKIFEKSASAGA